MVNEVMHENRTLRLVVTEAKIIFNTLKRSVQKKKQRGNDCCFYKNTWKRHRIREVNPYSKKNIFAYHQRNKDSCLSVCQSFFFIESWERNGCACFKWISDFIKHYPNLSIYIYKTTSITLARSFNPSSVS